MRVPAMAGDTTDGRDGIAFVVFFEGEIFLVYFRGHLVHMTGDVLFRFGIAGEIEVVRGTVSRGGVTEITFHAKGILPLIHYFLQLLVGDILFQYLEIVFGFRIILGTESGHAENDEAKQGGENGNFLEVKHGGIFGDTNLGKW